jgi:putative toxin-antitoxin system antitoxin component (TIGR02293 family)
MEVAKSPASRKTTTAHMALKAVRRLKFHDVLKMTPIERHELVTNGVETLVLLDLMTSYHHVSQKTLYEAIDISSKTLSRRENTRLTPRHSDATLALIEVTAMAERVLGSRELAENWLQEPALALDGKNPLELISSTPGIEAVKDLLTRIEYGVYA